MKLSDSLPTSRSGRRASWQCCQEQKKQRIIHHPYCCAAIKHPNLGIRNKPEANTELPETNKLLGLPKITSERLVKPALKRL